MAFSPRPKLIINYQPPINRNMISSGNTSLMGLITYEDSSTIGSGGTSVYYYTNNKIGYFRQLSGDSNILLYTGSTVNSGDTIIIGLQPNISVNSISATTFYSGSTDLSLLFGGGSSSSFTGFTGATSVGSGQTIIHATTGNTIQFHSISGGSLTQVSNIDGLSIVIDHTLFKSGSGTKSFILSGTSSTASGNFGFSLGQSNTNSGQYSSILNGASNVVTGNHNFVHGKSNTSNSNYSFINGKNNTILTGSTYSSVLGGLNNKIIVGAIGSFIGAGNSNSGSSNYSFVGAGKSNTAGSYSSVVAGLRNSNTQVQSFIGGGSGNTLWSTGVRSFIGAGKSNISNSDDTFIGSGVYNTIVNGINSAIIAGKNNLLSGTTYSLIGAGRNNIVGVASLGKYSVIVGGLNNSVLNGRFSFISNGSGHTINSNNGNNHTIIGGHDNAIKSANTSHITIINCEYLTATTSNSVYVPQLFMMSATTGGTHLVTYNATGNKQVQYKSLSAGTNVTIDDNGANILISATATGGTGTQTYVQDGLYIYTGGTSSAPTVNLSPDINLTSISATTIYSGATNIENLFVASGNNLGSGFAIFTGKSANNLQFKTLSAGTGINITTNNNVVQINNSLSIPSSAYLWNIGSGAGTIIGTATGNDSQSSYGLVFGVTNSIQTNNNYSSIISGKDNLIKDTSPYSSILGSKSGYVNFASFGSILGGYNNKVYSNSISYLSNYSSIINGKNNKVYQSKYSSILNGYNNRILNTIYSAILNGTNNEIDGKTNAVIIGSNITASQSDTLHVNYLNIQSATTGGDLMLTYNSTNGNVHTQSIPSGSTSSSINNGINTFTAGTSTFQSVNVTALTINNITVSGNSSFQSLSATTFYSGSTLLSTIISNAIGTGLTNTYVQNGTNTFTAGTAYLPSVNVTALTINSLTATGDTILSGSNITFGGASSLIVFQRPFLFANGTTTPHIANVGLTAGISFANSTATITGGLSAQTISGTTLYSGSTDLSNIFAVKKQTKYTTTQQIHSGTSTITANNLTLDLVTGKKYLINGVITISGATGGGRFGLSGSTAPVVNVMFHGNNSSSSTFQGHLTQINGLISAQTAAASSAIYYQNISGIIDCTGSTSTISLVFRAISGGNNICIQPNSFLTLEEI